MLREPGLFHPVTGRLRNISAVSVQISEWRAQKNMQPGSFQGCLMTEQGAEGTSSVKHRMFPVNNRKHFLTLRDQALTGGDYQEKSWCFHPWRCSDAVWTFGHCFGQSLGSQDDL